jgi:hypothetical protein
MPGAGVHILVDRVGGSEVSGGAGRSAAGRVHAGDGWTDDLGVPFWCARSAKRAGCAEGRRPGARGPAERSAKGARAEGALEPVWKVLTWAGYHCAGSLREQRAQGYPPQPGSHVGARVAMAIQFNWR